MEIDGQQNYFNKYLGLNLRSGTHNAGHCMYSPNFQLHRIRLENVITTKCFVDSRTEGDNAIKQTASSVYASCIPLPSKAPSSHP